VTQFWLVVGIPVILGLIVNEVSDLSPWLARKLLAYAAFRWAAGEDARFVTLHEEWAALIDDCPGKSPK